MIAKTMQIAVATLLLAAAASADALVEPDRAAAAEHWRAMARLDLNAAHALLRDNHPAMAPELGDTPFITRVEAAYAEAQKRIDTIDSFYGLRAVLAAFGNAAGDKHVRADFSLTRQYMVWPNFLVRAQGKDLIVTRAKDDTSATPAEGARLISCEGVAAEDLARNRIGRFHANWEIEAQRASESWRLLVDDRNPFVQAPKVCRFETKGVASDVTLQWGAATYDFVAPVIVRTNSSARAGFGIRRLANGAYWIALGQLNGSAEAVVSAAKKQAKEIGAAPYVVVDVRGNGGGSSSYGDRLADILLGPAKHTSANDEGGEAWRVSPGNAEAMEQFAASVKKNRADNTDLIKWSDETTSMLRAGVASGKRFAPALPDNVPPTPPFKDPPGGTPGNARVYLLTDYTCFSSCLQMTDTFKNRGAVQIGQPTDAATRYMEVRQILLPSRLASFSTLQKVALGAPAQIGPYEPARRYEGDMSDTNALERWIAQLARGK